MDTVLFDMDGTLLNTVTDLTNSVNFALRQQGLPVRSEDEVRLACGYGSRLLIDACTPASIAEGSPAFEELLETFQTHYNAHSNEATAPYEGIMDLLAALKGRGFKMAVVSNKAMAATEELRRLWFADYIDLAVGLTDKLPKKPAPDMALYALEKLGSSPAQAYYVGDSEPDAQIAKNAGCVGISVLWGFRDRATLEAQRPDHMAARPEQILDIIDGKAVS